MADHLWFIPAVGAGTGGGLVQESPNQNSLNVNYGSFPYPGGEDASLGIRVIHALAAGGGGNSAAGLSAAYASFGWRNSGNSSCNGISASLKLVVGTVFGADLITDSWDTVDVWCKFAVSDAAKLSGIYLALNGSGSDLDASSNLLPSLTSGWNIAQLTGVDVSEYEQTTNLRASMTFVGPSTFSGAALGEVFVDIEWFAIRLRDQN